MNYIDPVTMIAMLSKKRSQCVYAMINFNQLTIMVTVLVYGKILGFHIRHNKCENIIHNLAF